MRIEPLGDSAWIVRDLPAEPWRLARSLNASARPLLVEAVASYATLAIHFDPLAPPELKTVTNWIESADLAAVEPRAHIVPVCFELGDDLSEIASHAGLSEAEVANVVCSAEFVCVAVGFRPGFPYLTGLPAALSGMPRREMPRMDVGAGAIALTGDQCGIYPQPGPGGWNIFGRTPWTLERYGPIAEPGDRVRFISIDFEAYGKGRA